MKTLEEIKAMRDQRLNALNHLEYDGCPRCYQEGFSKALELMLERERVAVKALEYIVEHELYHGINQGKPSEQVAQETLDKLTKGEK